MSCRLTTKIRFYVDGLNFYYGVARHYRIKWIDLEKLLLETIKQKSEIPNITNPSVEKILLFTAYVKNSKEGSLDRQKIYLSSLRKHSASIELVLGAFQEVRKNGKIVGRNDEGIVQIETYEEKQTDVNLACKMVEDAYMKKYSASAGSECNFDICCLVSNDADMAYALQVKQNLSQRTLLITPRSEKTQSVIPKKLKEHVPKVDRISVIKKNLVEKCLLPDQIGNYHRPRRAGW